MVNIDDFKKRITEMLSSDYRLEFLGDNFEEIINLFSDTKAEKIYQWVQDIVALNIRPIVVGSSKTSAKLAVNRLINLRGCFKIN